MILGAVFGMFQPPYKNIVAYLQNEMPHMIMMIMMLSDCEFPFGVNKVSV